MHVLVPTHTHQSVLTFGNYSEIPVQNPGQCIDAVSYLMVTQDVPIVTEL